MFEQKISNEVFKMKYMINGETSPDDVFRGIAKQISSVESNDKKSEVEDTFYREMIQGRMIPGGRILANARPNGKMKAYSNCYTIGFEDSMESIYEAVKEDALISQSGGGVGFNVSCLRPEGSLISKGGESSGPVSFLKVFNESAKVIHTGGGRRCLPEYYEVQMFDKSWKKINQIKINDKIIFKNKEYTIQNFFENGLQNVIKIKTSNGYHISTPNHKWYVFNLISKQLEWIEAQYLYTNEIKYCFINPKV